MYKITILQLIFGRINSFCCTVHSSMAALNLWRKHKFSPHKNTKHQWGSLSWSRSQWSVTIIRHVTVCLGWRKFCQSASSACNECAWVRYSFVITYWDLKCMSVVTVAYYLRMKPKVQNFTIQYIHTLML
jgi:hypothetical protein